MLRNALTSGNRVARKPVKHDFSPCNGYTLLPGCMLREQMETDGEKRSI